MSITCLASTNGLKRYMGNFIDILCISFLVFLLHFHYHNIILCSPSSSLSFGWIFLALFLLFRFLSLSVESFTGYVHSAEEMSVWVPMSLLSPPWILLSQIQKSLTFHRIVYMNVNNQCAQFTVYKSLNVAPYHKESQFVEFYRWPKKVILMALIFCSILSLSLVPFCAIGPIGMNLTLFIFYCLFSNMKMKLLVRLSI